MAIIPIKLARLQKRFPIVEAKGEPTIEFHRLQNATAEQIEQTVNVLIDFANDILAAQAAADAAQAAADAAQATADAALAAAETGNGARYVSMTGLLPVSGMAGGVTTACILSLNAGLNNATLSANTSLDGTATLEEFDGVTTVVVGTAAFTLTSNGTQNPDLSWNTDGTSIQIDGMGALSGSITYTLSVVQTSGSTFVSMGDSSGTLVLTPEATP